MGVVVDVGGCKVLQGKEPRSLVVRVVVKREAGKVLLAQG
jgi:hypothetical protein